MWLLQFVVISACVVLYGASPTTTTQNSLRENHSGEIVRLTHNPNLSFWSRRSANQKRLCDTCLNSNSCKKLKRCERCKRLCEHLETDESTEEPTNVTNDSQSIDTNRNDIQSHGKNDVVGSPKDTQTQPIIPFINPFHEDSNASPISNNSLLYYTVGKLGPGPRQNLLARLLQVKNKDNLDQFVVLAKPKTDATVTGQQKPLIIDTANVFEENPNLKQQQQQQAPPIRPSDLKLAATIDKSLSDALHQGRELLTVQEIDKIISNIVKDFNKFNQPMANPIHENSPPVNNFISSPSKNAMGQSQPKPAKQTIANRFGAEQDGADSNEIPVVQLTDMDETGPALRIDKKSAENFGNDDAMENSSNPTVGSNWLAKSASQAKQWLEENVMATAPSFVQEPNDDGQSGAALVAEIHDLSRKFEHLEDLFKRTCGQRFQNENARTMAVGTDKPDAAAILPGDQHEMVVTVLPTLSSRFADEHTPANRENVVGEPGAVIEDFEKTNETVACSNEVEGEYAGASNDMVGSPLKHKEHPIIDNNRRQPIDADEKRKPVLPNAVAPHLVPAPPTTAIDQQPEFKANRHRGAISRKTIANAPADVQFAEMPEETRRGEASRNQAFQSVDVAANEEGNDVMARPDAQSLTSPSAGAQTHNPETSVRKESLGGAPIDVASRLSDEADQVADHQGAMIDNRHRALGENDVVGASHPIVIQDGADAPNNGGQNDTVGCSEEKDDDVYLPVYNSGYRKSESNEARTNDEDQFANQPTDGAAENAQFASQPTDGAIENAKFVNQPTDGAVENAQSANQPTDGAVENAKFANEPTDGAIDAIQEIKSATDPVNVRQEPKPAILPPPSALLNIKPLEENLKNLLHPHHHHRPLMRSHDGVVGDRQQSRFHLGKLIPLISQDRDKVMFSGDGVRLPINMQKNTDGSINLFVDIGKMVNGQFVGNAAMVKQESAPNNAEKVEVPDIENGKTRERRQDDLLNIPKFVVDTVFQNLPIESKDNVQLRDENSNELSDESSEEKIIANATTSRPEITTSTAKVVQTTNAPKQQFTSPETTTNMHLPSSQDSGADVTHPPQEGRVRRSLVQHEEAASDDDQVYERKLQRLNNNMENYYAKRRQLDNAYKNKNKVDLEGDAQATNDIRRRLGIVNNILTWLQGVTATSKPI